MIFRGRHLTRYTFDAPVTLDPHTLRLQPRGNGAQRLRQFALSVSPTPVMQTETSDAEGNALHGLWFLGPTTHLTLETQFEVETLRANPFDFIPSEADSLPPRLSPDERDVFLPHLRAPAAPSIQTLAQQIAAGCENRAVTFASQAATWIHANITSVPRLLGNPRPPETTLEEKRGACRDLAVLLIALCRAAGIPARFVSGYQDTAGDSGTFDLHAWTEVWLSGGGWRGFDPSQGLAVSDHHIALAGSAFFTLAAPVSGSYHGNVISCSPEHQITLDICN